MKKEEKKYILLWSEHIDLVKFLIGLIISIVFTLLVIRFLIPKDSENKLLYSLIPILISFLFNALWIKPKRNIKIEENKDDN